MNKYTNFEHQTRYDAPDHIHKCEKKCEQFAEKITKVSKQMIKNQFRTIPLNFPFYSSRLKHTCNRAEKKQELMKALSISISMSWTYHQPSLYDSHQNIDHGSTISN